MDNHELPKIAVRKLDPSSAKKLQAEAKASKAEKKKINDRGREDVVGPSVEKEKDTEAEVESFQLDFGEFPLNASLLDKSHYARRVASKLISPADAERFGNTSDALLADHMITASIVTSQVSCEAARRFLAVETRAKKYEEENRRLKLEVLELDSKHVEETRLLTQEVLELESKLINATTLSEFTKEELDLLRAKTRFLEDSARKNSGNNFQFKEDRIQELELELKSTREAAKKEKEEAINTAYQQFVKDLAQRDEFLAAKYYTKGRNSAKLQIKQRDDVEMSEVELDSDYDEYQSDVNNCPVRERQSCERLVEVIENDSSRKLLIRKGRGTALKDIPNVSYKMSRVKNDEIFKQLHMVLYGTKRGEANQVKHNVSQFSGFVWQEDEEKERLNIKEKLGSFVKAELLQFCDLLDIRIIRASNEDILLKLLDFLEAPHSTTDILLVENNQGSKGSKRKSSVKQNSPSGATPSKNSAKRQRKVVEDSKEKGKSPIGTDDESDEDEELEEENEEDIQDQSEDEKHSSGEEIVNTFKQVSADESKNHKRSSSYEKKESFGMKKAHEVPAKTTPKKSNPNSSKIDVSDECRPKMFLRKCNDVKIANKEPSTPKSAPKEKSGKKITNVMETPTDSDLWDTICEILEEVDFNTATLTDVIKRLESRPIVTRLQHYG